MPATAAIRILRPSIIRLTLVGTMKEDTINEPISGLPGPPRLLDSEEGRKTKPERGDESPFPTSIVIDAHRFEIVGQTVEVGGNARVALSFPTASWTFGESSSGRSEAASPQATV